jgi:hypothetical protein
VMSGEWRKNTAPHFPSRNSLFDGSKIQLL